MNKIEQLPKTINVDGEEYTLEIHVTAWDRFCIQYEKITNPDIYLCAVTVEEEKDPKGIKDTFGHQVFNQGIGNARTFDDAIDMIDEFITPLIIVSVKDEEKKTKISNYE